MILQVIQDAHKTANLKHDLSSSQLHVKRLLCVLPMCVHLKNSSDSAFHRIIPEKSSACLTA